jgi:hypothetical protein
MRLGVRNVISSLLPLVMLGCGARGDLRFPVSLGKGRSAAESTLEKQKFCRHEPRQMQSQSYVRCRTKGFAVGEAWLVVDYSEEQKVVRVRRMEHYPTHAAATKRWNALVAERSEELGAESEAARDVMASMGEAPVGAVVWKVWRKGSSGHILGLYLVKPDEADDPNVVEVLRRDSAR